MGQTKLSVILIVICAVKCLAMTYDELEDFAEYLRKTSQLSPTLKQGTRDFDDFEEDELISENAWEESGKFEGDMILNERQRRLILDEVAEGLARNGVLDSAKRWPDNEVIFAIQVEHFTSDQVQAILGGIDDLARASCVKFRRYRKGDRDAVVIQGNRRGCFSQVGYQGGFQALNLWSRHPVGRGCFRHGTIVHEMLHALGFYHMQSSPDRDDYVNIVWRNINPAARHNFQKYNTFSVSDFGVGYDYDSVLHYGRTAFTINGKDTIVPRQVGAQIGQRTSLSEKDVQKLNKMYCDADLDSVLASDEDTKKTKKKSSKNKPFQGHGIGYHKGMAAVIKLLPAAESYKLPDVPSLHVFDYFSKAPKILSSPENEDFRDGKDIKYPYDTPKLLITQEYKDPVDKRFEIGSHVKQIKPNVENQEVSIHPELMKVDLVTVMQEMNKGTKIGSNGAASAVPFSDAQGDTENPDLIEAFDRLSKIIKSHVYPSQTPDLSIYKTYESLTKHENNPTNLENSYSALYASREPKEKGENIKSTMHYEDDLPKTLMNDFYKNKKEVIPGDNEKYTKFGDPYNEGHRGGDDYAKYSPKIWDVEKYTSYKFNPYKFNNDGYSEYSKKHLEDDYEDGISLYDKPSLPSGQFVNVKNDRDR